MSKLEFVAEDNTLLTRVFGKSYVVTLGENVGDKMYKVTFLTKKGEGWTVGDSLEECMRMHLETEGMDLECASLNYEGGGKLKECDYWFEDNRPCRYACTDERLGHCLKNLWKL